MIKIFELLKKNFEFKKCIEPTLDTMFEKFISKPRRILLYNHSSPGRSSVVAYFNRTWLKDLPDEGPEIIVVPGYYEDESIFKNRKSFMDDPTKDAELSHLGPLKTTSILPDGGRRKLYLTKVQLPHGEVWVLETSLWTEDEMISLFLNEKIKIQYIYSENDSLGIWPSVYNVFSLSPVFYPPFYDALGVVAHINDTFLEIESLENGLPFGWKYPTLLKTKKITKKIKDKELAKSIEEKISLLPQMPKGFRKILLNKDGKTEFMSYKGFEEQCMLLRETFPVK